MVPTVLGGFRFTEHDFSSNHWTRELCLEKPRSWGLRTLPSDEPMKVDAMSIENSLHFEF